MKQFYLLTLLLFTCTFLSASGQEKITALVLKDFPPQYQTDLQGNPTGFAIDMIEEVAKIANLKIEYRVYDTWEESNKAFFDQGIGDIIPNSGITPKRLANAIFTTPMETFLIRAFKRSNSTRLQTLEDIKEHMVGVVNVNRGHTLMQAKKHPKELLKIYPDSHTALNALISGEIDVFIFPEPPIIAKIKEAHLENQITPFGKPLMEIKRGIRIQKNRPELAEKLDNALRELLDSPRYLEIYQRWYTNFISYRDRKTIRSATELDYPPFSVITDGYADGFSVELFRAALKAMDKEVTFRIGPWDKIKTDLSMGKLDALPLVGRTPEREKYFDFSIPYIQLFGALIIRKDTTNINSAADLKDKELIVMKGDNADEFARRENLTEKLLATDSYEEALKLLSTGKGDAVLVQRIVGQNLMDSLNFPNLKMLEKPVVNFRQDFCFAVQKGSSELLAILNDGLAITKADGTFKRLHEKWFPHLYKQNVSRIVIYVLSGILSLVFLVLLFVWFWKRSLEGEIKTKTTELTKSYQSLEQQSEKMLSLLERVKGVSWEMRFPSEEFTYISPNVEQIFGYPASHWVNKKSWAEIIHPDDRQEAVEFFLEKAKKGENHTSEYRIVKPDGNSTWVLQSVDILKDQYDNPWKLTGFTLDIQLFKQQQHELMKNQALYRSLVNSLPMSVYRIDLQGYLTYVNKTFLSVLGKTDKETLGKSIYDFYPRELIERHRQENLRVINEKKVIHNTEQTTDSQSSDPTYTESIKIPVFDEQGNIEGIQGIFWDITDRKKIEEELKQVNVTLEKRVKNELERARKQEQLLIQQSKMAEMGNMIGAIVHQWKQPITSIHMTAELVEEDAELETLEQNNVLKHMHNIIEQVDFMSKTMNDFRNYFLPSKTKKQFLLKKSIEDLYAMLKKGFTNHDVTVTINGNENVSAYGYDNEFKQVLLNILNNANDVFIESKRKDGKINIDIYAKGERAIITVTDNGGGIASELLPEKIFEPYITTKGEKGTGIGLSMSKSIIESNMGGELMVRNIEGGAEFTIELPMSEKPEQKNTSWASSMPKMKKSPVRPCTISWKRVLHMWKLPPVDRKHWINTLSIHRPTNSLSATLTCPAWMDWNWFEPSISKTPILNAS